MKSFCLLLSECSVEILDHLLLYLFAHLTGLELPNRDRKQQKYNKTNKNNNMRK